MVLERDGYRCRIGGPGCLVDADQVDHILSWRLGGAVLGTGRSYGTFPVNRGTLGDLSLVLNADAVADINASRPGYFSLGGRLLSFSRPDAEFRFGGTEGLVARLIVDAFPLPRTPQECKGGGWRNLTDDRGEPFRSQGQCILFVRQHPQI